jgi:hypothetical protein
MKKYDLQAGFSAVELLVTLFIGFLFITMGFQLYSVTIQANKQRSDFVSLSLHASKTLESLTDGSSPLQTQYPNCPSGSGSYTFDYWWAAYRGELSCPNPIELPTLRLLTITAYNKSVTDQEVTHARYFFYN